MSVFAETKVAGSWLITPEPQGDDRGFFARLWCSDEARAHGMEPSVKQINSSFNISRGTLRGLHLQLSPDEEAKLVRCINGAIFDVVADLRPDSPTYLQWFGAELTAEDRVALYIPPGCAHGYQTLEDSSEVLYHVSAAYAPQSESGARYDDPLLGITWPLPVSTISDKDSAWPALTRT